MTPKPPWTDEEKFWRSIRQATLGLVDAVETYRLARHISVRTAEIRERLKSYQQRERIAELTAEKIVELTTQAECDKL